MTKKKQPNIIKQYDKCKLIGKLDLKWEMIPTDGRMKKKKIDVTPMLPLTEIKRCFYGATYALGQLVKARGCLKISKLFFQQIIKSY